MEKLLIKSNNHQLYYQPKDVWVGDVMPYGKEGKFFIYHQRDTRNPVPFGEPFGWALATTKDFVHFEDFGESLLRGDDNRETSLSTLVLYLRQMERFTHFIQGIIVNS